MPLGMGNRASFGIRAVSNKLFGGLSGGLVKAERSNIEPHPAIELRGFRLGVGNSF